MTTINPSAGQSKPPSPVGEDTAGCSRVRLLRLSFCVLVVLLAIFQFSENTADPDLWGHVVFGQEMMQTHSIPKTEMYSWTAHGQPWVNHECLAEISLGAAHNAMGGSGLLLLKMVIGLLTFGLCLRLGQSDLWWPDRYLAWALAALAVVEISYGFAARPQIFTALFLALELALLRRIHLRYYLWAAVIPVLFAIWINTHGGALAGFGLLGLAAGATTAQFLWHKIRTKVPNTSTWERSQGVTTIVPDIKMLGVLWLAVGLATAALFCNPWKGELLRWLVGSILWLRPQIAEWNPTPFGWDHAALFILVALAGFAWAFTRRRRAWWELAACGAFTLLALRSVRNAPLCGVVMLALVSPHLADSLGRFQRLFSRWQTLRKQAGFQKFATALFLCASVAVAVATLKLHKEHPFTMEVPRANYPTGAVAFLRDNELRGKMITFFDWGEMVIFHLPDCPPSIDGRLDTCYSRELIDAHWKFYNGEPFDESVFSPDEADLALLPTSLAGATALAQHPGWHAVYFDDTAVILARKLERFPKLQKLTLPISGPKSAGSGRAAFADQSARAK
jgi:hypothetical protein